MTAMFQSLVFSFSCLPAAGARPLFGVFIVGFFNNQMTGGFRCDHETTISRRVVKKKSGRRKAGGNGAPLEPVASAMMSPK
jgi:hypothetical protein